MRIKQSGVVIALVFASTAALAEPLDVKPGLWEVTATTEMSGMAPIDTSKMTHEQKARVEAAMKKRQGQGSRAHVRKTCMTEEKIKREPFQEKDMESCSYTVISSTRTKWQAKRICTKPKSVGEFKVEALSREHIKSTVQINASDDKHAMAVHVSMDGKWIGSNCGKIK